LDEPTSSLGRGDAERLFELIRDLRADGVSVIYISHFLEEVQAISDRYTVLRDGRTVGSGATRDATPEKLVAMMVGRSVSELYPRSRRAGERGDVVLEVRDLSGVAKPRAASLALHRGEVVGIAG